MVNPDVDGQTKTLNHRKIIRKTHKNNKVLKTKRMLKQKYKFRWDWLLHYSPLYPPSVTPLAMIYCI